MCMMKNEEPPSSLSFSSSLRNRKEKKRKIVQRQFGDHISIKCDEAVFVKCFYKDWFYFNLLIPIYWDIYLIGFLFYSIDAISI